MSLSAIHDSLFLALDIKSPEKLIPTTATPFIEISSKNKKNTVYHQISMLPYRLCEERVARRAK